MSWKTRLLTRRVYRPRGYHLVTCRLLVTWLEFSFQKHAALIFSCLQEHPSSAVISSKALGIFFFFFPPTQQKTKSTCRLLFFGWHCKLEKLQGWGCLPESRVTHLTCPPPWAIFSTLSPGDQHPHSAAQLPTPPTPEVDASSGALHPRGHTPSWAVPATQC